MDKRIQFTSKDYSINRAVKPRTQQLSKNTRSLNVSARMSVVNDLKPALGFDNPLSVEKTNREYVRTPSHNIQRFRAWTQSFQKERELFKFSSDINILKRFYRFNTDSPIKSFLMENQFLIPLLKEIPERIADSFGVKQNLALEVSSESGFSDSSELWVKIVTENSVDEAMNGLDKLDKDWWLESMDRAEFKLNISVEYI